MLHPVEIIIGLLAVACGLGVLARWMRVPYPILLVIGGLLLSFQPWFRPFSSEVALDPQLVFLFFLPPLLYAGAFRMEWPEFRANIRSITLLAVGLVCFTTAVVAVVAHHWVGLPWGAAVVLGAIVSPPDAVAAMAVLARVRVPKIVVTVLEGESLVNDAAALVLLRVAVAAVAAGGLAPGEGLYEFFRVGFGGLGLGLAGGWLVVRLHRWLDRHDLADSKLTITITLLTPFALYLPAEHLHVSGVLAVVACGLWVGNRCEQVFTEELYQEARAVWEWIEFLLNSLIFILIGLQLSHIVDELIGGFSLGELAWQATVVSLAVIVARFVWVYPGAYVPRWIDEKVFGLPVHYPPWQSVFVVGWTGMRGVVSLAAALALPHFLPNGREFPARHQILFLTFWVIFVTLVVQGLTLPLVIRWLGVGRERDPKRENTIDSPGPTP